MAPTVCNTALGETRSRHASPPSPWECRRRPANGQRDRSTAQLGSKMSAVVPPDLPDEFEERVGKVLGPGKLAVAAQLLNLRAQFQTAAAAHAHTMVAPTATNRMLVISAFSTTRRNCSPRTIFQQFLASSPARRSISSYPIRPSEPCLGGGGEWPSSIIGGG